MLQEIIAYSETHLAKSEPGFKAREVRWLIEISSDGRFLNAVPLGDGRRGKTLTHCPEMSGMNSGGKSHFLVETAQTGVQYFKNDEDPKNIAKSEIRHRFFVGLIREASRTVTLLEPLAVFLDNKERLAEVRQALSQNKARPSDWIVWHIDDFDLRDNSEVQSWWREWRKTDQAEGSTKPGHSETTLEKNTMTCFLTGNSNKPLATHPKISGLSGVGGLAMGDVMVGFDKDSFGSYGLEQSANSAMGEEAVQKYVDGLNDLIRNHTRKIGNALVAHWYKDAIPMEADPLSFLMGIDSQEQIEAEARISVRRLLDAIRSGQRAQMGKNRYFALTVSGAAGRVMVRDWMEGSFEDLVSRIDSWFSDLAIISRDGNGNAHGPKFMAICGSLVRELKDLPAPTAATMWKVAIQGLPIPQPLMAQALARFRAGLIADEPFNHARMGLIKAYYIRRNPGGDATMTASYNPNHPAPAYHCGGLLAVLANLQRAALGDVGAGVTQRFYNAASQTPGLVFGRLAANARHHLAKLEPRLAWWHEERMMEIMSRLGDGAPRTLDLEGQGLFALGYYQKLAELRAGIKSNKLDTDNKGEKK